MDATVEAGSVTPVLPTGTLTLLFTDIEGSTRLEVQVGTTRYAELRERHRVLLRTAFASSGGIEIETEGDSFFVVFERPSSAVTAAAAAQRALAAEAWPADVTLQVRMGLHTGEVELSGGSYVGTAVNRAARIAAAGHGGQVLLSATCAALVRGVLPDGVSLRELGVHRLRDLPFPESLAQLEIDGLRHEFPALRTVERPNTLPAQVTTFLGREAELSEAERLLAGTRLLTLTGPGGTGKTRLAVRLAERAADAYPDGVYYVAMEPIRDPALALTTIAAAVGVTDGGADGALTLLADRLGSGRVMLLVDNFEQVITAAPSIGALLRATPNVTVVVTSRTALRLAGEQQYVVPGLPVPPDPTRLPASQVANLPNDLRTGRPDAIGRFESVRLFVDRARSVRSDFDLTAANAAAVGTIVARLNGMPLAIELAAARVRVLEPDEILRRLDHQLAALAGGSVDLPDRQRSLRAAIAWSHDLLDEPGRRLLVRLSVFRGGFELEAAEAVCADTTGRDREVVDGISALLDQSLVRRMVEAGRPGRLRVAMVEAIREFAAERLALEPDAAAVRERHARHYLALAEEARPKLGGEDQRAWLDRLELEHDNLRAAIDWAIERPAIGIALQLVVALWRFWQKRGHLLEAEARLASVLALPDARSDRALYARALEASGGVTYWRGEFAAAEAPYREALAIWRSLDDPAELANALYNVAFVAEIVGLREEAAALAQEALGLYRALDDHGGIGNVLWGIGASDIMAERFEAARTGLAEAGDQYRAAGDRTGEAWSEHMLGTVELALDDLAAAQATFARGLSQFVRAGDVLGVALCLMDLATTAARRGQIDRAGRLVGASKALQQTVGSHLLEASARNGPPVWQGPDPSLFPPGRLEAWSTEGAAWSLDEAVAYALEGSQPPSG